MKSYKLLEFVIFQKSSLPFVEEGDGSIRLIIQNDDTASLKVLEYRDGYKEEDVELHIALKTIEFLEQFANSQNKMPTFVYDAGYDSAYILTKVLLDGKKRVSIYDISKLKYLLKDILPNEIYVKIFDTNN